MKNSRIQGPKAVLYLRKQPGMTEQVTRDLHRKLSRLRHIPREIPPVKGAFIAYLQDKGKDKLLSWTLFVKRKIVQELRKLSSSTDSRYQSLLDMELFQFDQKGPMSPIPSDVVVADVVPNIAENSMLIPKLEAKRKLLSFVAAVGKKYGQYMALKSRDLTSLNFENA